MSPREIREPSVGEDGVERHPAFGMIGAARVQSGGGGAVLYDSDVRHQHFVTIRLSTGARRRQLSHDHLYPEQQLVEVAMSEAQWASFVSSMNVGSGVPCTVEFTAGEGKLPGIPYAPRLKESMDEVRGAADRAASAVAEAFATYREHKTAANLRTLQATIENMPANVAFAAESLSEHAENVVQKARADIEAMVVAKAEQLKLDPADLDAGVLQLGEGS